MSNQAVTSSPLDVIIIGAGLGGLAASISIRLSGHEVTVVEAAKELLEVGAGLQLTPNATRILQQWKLPEQFWQSAAEPTSLFVHRYEGQILAQEDDFHKHMRSKYGAPFLDMHRVDLQLALYEKAKEVGVKFELGQRVEDVQFNPAKVVTDTGMTLEGDLVVAADGLWSKSRSVFTGQPSQVRATGDLAYRILINLDQVEDPELRRWISEPTCHFWIGPGAHAVGYSMRGGNMYNIVLLVPDNLPEGVTRQAGSIEEMRALFENWDPILNKFLGLVDKVEKWKLMHIDELPNWVNDESNLVFLGDSCHPMLPYLAQGANSAIEDGAVLGLLLGHIKEKKDLPQALQAYQKLRKDRGSAIVKETFEQRKSFHMPDGPEQVKRDEIFLSQLGKPLQGAFPSRWTCPQVQPWLYGYDAFEEVEEAMKESPFHSPETVQTQKPAAPEPTAKKTGLLDRLLFIFKRLLSKPSQQTS